VSAKEKTAAFTWASSFSRIHPADSFKPRRKDTNENSDELRIATAYRCLVRASWSGFPLLAVLAVRPPNLRVKRDGLGRPDAIRLVTKPGCRVGPPLLARRDSRVGRI